MITMKQDHPAFLESCDKGTSPTPHVLTLAIRCRRHDKGLNITWLLHLGLLNKLVCSEVFSLIPIHLVKCCYKCLYTCL